MLIQAVLLIWRKGMMILMVLVKLVKVKSLVKLKILMELRLMTTDNLK